MAAQKKIPVRYFYYGMAITALLIGAVFFFVWKKEAKQEALLREKGIKAEAWVMKLHESYSKKKRGKKIIYQHYMDVALFADTTSYQPIVKDTAVSKAKNGPDMVEKLFNKIHSEDKPFGTYTTITIPVHKMAFSKYKVEDKVKIIYLKEDLTIARLAEEL